LDTETQMFVFVDIDQLNTLQNYRRLRTLIISVDK